jgi:superfamily I DNA/RNA helicase
MHYWWDDEQRSTSELVQIAITAFDSNDSDHAIAVLSCRGTQAEFDAAAALVRNPNRRVREIGARIMGQLGGYKPTFIEESLPLLFACLSDPFDDVIAAAAIALGHRNDPRSVPYLVSLKNHHNENVRDAVAYSLSSCHNDDPAAIEVLIELSRDEDRDVRDWATFGLGTQCDLDTPAIRDACVERLAEEDDGIRGEALIGLAKRHDPRGFESLIRELQGEFYGSWSLEAAEEWADPRLLPYLANLRQRLLEENVADRFINNLDDAIQACQPK